MIVFDLVLNATEEIFADENSRKQRTYWVYPKRAGNTELRHHI
jgi:hypothetical protein